MKKNKTREGKNTGTHVDITARKQAKAALQESEKRYRLLAENVSDVIWTMDLDLKFTYVSPSSKLMAGYPPEEVMAMNLEQLLTSASLELAKKTLAEELSLEQQGEDPQRSLTLELEHIGKDGSLIWAEAKVTFLRDSQGRPVGIQGVSRDISARKRSEEALRKSEESLARLNDCLLGFGNDSDKNIQRLVEVGGEILGADYALYSRLQDDKLFSLGQWQTPPDYRAVDLAEGRICFDVIRQSPAMPLVVRNLQGSHYAQSDTNVMRFKLQTYIGTAVHCQQVAVGAICVVYQADIDPNQNDLYLLNIIANAISVEEERKRAQEALQKAEKKYRSIFENAIEGIFQSTPGGIYIGANTAMAKMFGYESPEDLMADISDIKKQVYVDPHQMVEFMRLLERDGFVKDFEYQAFRKDGSTFLISENARSVKNEKGEIYCYEGFMQDITKRNQAEESLLDSEKKLVNIVNFLPDATFVIDTKGKVITWNKAIEEMTGVKAKDMVGKGNYEYALPFYGERRPILIDLVLEPDGIEKYDEVKRENRALMAVVHFNNFRGKESYLFGKASALIDLHGNIIGSIESIRDITALQQAETERLRFSKLESLSILAGGIAHDFNNILTAILGNIGLAMLDGKIEPQVQDRLAQAEQACLRARALSQKLLTFANGGAPIKKIVSLANLLKELAILTLSGSNSRYEGSFPDDLWSVEADTAQLNQVIGNLLINADQAMPEGGIIKITAENISVKAKSNLPISKGKYVKFAIADQGIGISPQYLDKIFDPYFSTKQKGSGLGLATAYSIIKYHFGHIQVESRMGVGTTFHIYLPAADKGVPAAEPETVKPTMGQGKVLVMDDEEMVREVLGGMLSRLGYEADFASDGSKAIEKFVKARETNQPFTALILDLTIPGGMGGKETMARLREIDPQVKAIVSSGYSDDPIMADFQKYGFSGVIAKPYKVAELGKVLNKVLIGGD